MQGLTEDGQDDPAWAPRPTRRQRRHLARTVLSWSLIPSIGAAVIAVIVVAAQEDSPRPTRLEAAALLAEPSPPEPDTPTREPEPVPGDVPVEIVGRIVHDADHGALIQVEVQGSAVEGVEAWTLYVNGQRQFRAKAVPGSGMAVPTRVDRDGSGPTVEVTAETLDGRVLGRSDVMTLHNKEG